MKCRKQCPPPTPLEEAERAERAGGCGGEQKSWSARRSPEWEAEVLIQMSYFNSWKWACTKSWKWLKKLSLLPTFTSGDGKRETTEHVGRYNLIVPYQLPVICQVLMAGSHITNSSSTQADREVVFLRRALISQYLFMNLFHWIKSTHPLKKI